MIRSVSCLAKSGESCRLSPLCGPGAPICAIAVVLVGSVAGGVAGGAVADSLDAELQEYSHWDIF